MDSGGPNPAAFNDGLHRARQLAAQMSADGETGNALGLKREFDEPGPASKKQMTEGDLGMSVQMNQSSDAAVNAAKAAAAQVAAKLNQNFSPALTSPGAPVMPTGMGLGGLGTTQPGNPAQGGMGPTVNEDYSIPDRMVGLVIGKGGEQITRLQAESGCRVQIAPSSGGLAERSCTLSGTPEAIARVKGLIHDIIHKAKTAGTPESVPNGQNLVEMMIPGSKVGLIIGKGGETIRMLQESTGCKMVMIQDTNTPTDSEKPLRITGPLASAEEARRRVQELLDSKDSLPPAGQSGGFNDYGSSGFYSQELACPSPCVGIIIGKSGDVIKRIQNDYSVRVQFRPDDGGPERRCQVTGSPDAVGKAVGHIQSLIEEANGADMNNRNMGMNRPGAATIRPGFGGDMGNSTSLITVPSDKCGLIIGKGGETIRDIVNMSGARVQLQRNTGAGSSTEKTFEVKGSPEAIQHALSLISDKAGIPPPAPTGMSGPPGGAPTPWGAPAPQWGQAPGFGGQQQQQPPWNQYGGYNQWGGQGDPNQQQQGQTAPAQPPAANTQDAWSQYYQQYYQQQQQQPAGGQQAAYPPAQPMAPGQPATNGNQPAMPAAGGAPQGGAPPAASAVNPQTGQPDYSQAWAQYYRSMGYHDQAEAILAQSRGGATQAAPTQ